MAEIAPFAGVLTKDERDRVPALYRCHQEFEHHGRTLTRKGFLALGKLSPFSDGVIRPHLPAPHAAERLKQMRELRAHSSAPFGLYCDRQFRVDDLFAESEQRQPDFTDERDGIILRIWRLTDEKTQARVATIIEPEKIYLATGHDEYEAMLALRAEGAASEWGPLYLCNEDDPGLALLPTHRVLFSVPQFQRGDFLQRCKEYFTVAEGPLSGPDAVRAALAGQAKRGPAFAVVTPGVQQIAYLRLRGDLIKASVPQLGESRALGELDLSYLRVVFEDILQVDAAAHVRFVQGLDQALAELAAPDVQALFLLNPTRLDALRAVVDEGRLMPPHSTTFHPAAPSVAHPIDPAESVHLPSLY